VLTGDFFTNLLSPGTRWRCRSPKENLYEIRFMELDRFDLA
jgi:catalase-peroxidase